jgi:hypothetical protein
MLYRPCPDIAAPDEANLDDPAMAEAAIAVERAEQDLRMLSRLTDEIDALLYDCDEFRDFLDRPVGETIARLCKTLGLDPALCVRDGDGWKVRREPFPFELKPPSPSWGGTDGEAVRVGKSEASTGPAGFS